jgi:hypothetical protein
MNPILERLLPKDSPWIEYGQYALTKSDRAKSGYSKKRLSELDIRMGFEGRLVKDPLKIHPFMAGYILTWEPDGHLYYESVQTGNKVKTLITVQRIVDYYELITRIEKEGILPPLPTGIKGDGKLLNYSLENYSPIAYLNYKYKTFNEWWEAAQRGEF